MTNAQIIFNAQQELAEEGKIAYTGKTFKAVDGAGQEIELKETEPIHTYRAWKELGYQVRKGQKAVAKITIWKHSGPKVETIPQEDGREAQVIDKGRMFMKTAAFFAESQVEAIAQA